MEKITTESNDTKGAQPGDILNNQHALRELDEWWKTMLEISTQIDSPKLQKKFLELVISARERKYQVCNIILDSTMQIIDST